VEAAGIEPAQGSHQAQETPLSTTKIVTLIVGFASGFDYLLRLSTIAVAFVGWSAIVVTLRRALGAELGALHMYFVRFFIEGGLAVAAFGLLPAALSLTDLGDATVWRLSSVGAALLFTVYLAFLLRRRRRVTAGRLPVRTVVAFVTSVAAVVALWVNTVGAHLESSASTYALALTWLLVVGGWVFVDNLELFFGYSAVQVTSPQGEPAADVHAQGGGGS